MTSEAKRYMRHRAGWSLGVMLFCIPPAIVNPLAAAMVIVFLSMFIADLCTEHENPWKDQS